MSERRSYVHGTPSWVDLGTPDMDQSKAFYAEALGWTALTLPDPEAGGYTLFHSRGRQVAGCGPLHDGDHPSWTTYISVDDADKATAAARDAGGSVLVEPVAVAELGRMALLADPTGATFAVWQPGTHAGAELVNEPGAFCWNELFTAQPEVAVSFYETVFGWSPVGDESYTELRLGKRGIAGMIDASADGDTRSGWLVYFAVADCDGTAGRIRSLGGAVLKDPADIPGVGRFAVVEDPHGVEFAVIELTNPQ